VELDGKPYNKNTGSWKIFITFNTKKIFKSIED
jgi:hypothetical protein